MSVTVITITPRMDLNEIAELAWCDRAEAAFILLEMLAEGHWARRLDSITEAELRYLLDRACARMDQLGIPS